MRRHGAIGLIGSVLLILGTMQAAHGAPKNTLITRDSNGGASNGDSATPVLSENGRFIVYTSVATDLVPNDGNTSEDVFVFDRKTGDNERVSVKSNGSESAGFVGAVSISANGRYVVMATAMPLVAADTDGGADIYLRDRSTDKTKRISLNSAEEPQQGGFASFPDVSDDGRFIVFTSGATNLVSGDTNGFNDVFIRDRQQGTTRRVSVTSDENQAEDGFSTDAQISGDGRKVAFASEAEDLVDSDSASSDLFLRNLTTGTTVLVDVNNFGNPGTLGAEDPAISRDGRFVAFSSDSPNLVGDDDAGYTDVFLRDFKNKRTTRLSVDPIGNEGDGRSVGEVCISSNGRYVSFASAADNLTGFGPNGGIQGVFRHDTYTGRTVEFSIKATGALAEGDTGCMSGDGEWIAYGSDDDDIVNNQPANTYIDIFLRGPVP